MVMGKEGRGAGKVTRVYCWTLGGSLGGMGEVTIPRYDREDKAERKRKPKPHTCCTCYFSRRPVVEKERESVCVCVCVSVSEGRCT